MALILIFPGGFLAPLLHNASFTLGEILTVFACMCLSMKRLTVLTDLFVLAILLVPTQADLSGMVYTCSATDSGFLSLAI